MSNYKCIALDTLFCKLEFLMLSHLTTDKAMAVYMLLVREMLVAGRRVGRRWGNIQTR